MVFKSVKKTKAEQNQNRYFLCHVFNTIFLLTWHFRFSKSYPEIESTWPTAKCRGRKSFDTWYYLVTCAMLCLIFSSKLKAINVFPKHSEIEGLWPINSKKEELVLSHDSKELFVQRFMKVFDQNWKHVEAGNQRTDTPGDFTVRGRTVRSSHWTCFIGKIFLKILQYPQETPVLESIFKKVADL